MNFAVVSVADVGFIIFVLRPDYVSAWPGVAGPLFWLLGLAFSTAALPAGALRRGD